MSRGARLRPSLLAALFARALTLLVLVIAIAGALAFWSARGQIGRSYDAALIAAANALYALMGEELQEAPAVPGIPVKPEGRDLLSAEDRAAFDVYAHQRMFRIWRHSVLALASDTGPPPGATVTAGEGFRNVRQGRVTWRIYTLPIPARDIVLEVGEQLQERGVLVRSVALELAFPLMLLIPAAAALIWLSLADGLRALRSLASELRRRSLQDLSEIDPGRWPRDLIPLIRATNHLFQRLAHAFQQERRFIDHAAHQLRTPLATIKLQTQMIAREPDDASRQELVKQLEASVNRAADLNARLLTLARLETETRTAGAAELAAETASVLADFAPLAASRQIGLAYEGGVAAVSADAMLVRLVVANLVENAIRHTPPDGEVAVSTGSDDEASWLVVADTGPGIAPEERLRVFERFYRGADAGAGGAGLGLAIVAEAVRVLGGRVELADRPDGAAGLYVRVTIPRAPPGAA